ncbi:MULTISPECIES: hypothetical protein [unclassified Leptolyngbya]|uniref:hypothetical protein n=1 Tax=unclassified Leptolyngbya TaxID=2650499 RepID=UPI0016896299|nr:MULTISPECIES: hypothetical protein [unclassified Leptolyngbya]MBD1913142.1 hypothetical protein [Leptolyngbya sp. FACHB-8]MBD2158819.1 hypothetical protein [Leptolyngbya sp. FACHB-16]
MRAVRFDRFGSPSELPVQDVPKSEPQENKVLIEIQAASVNPSDVKNIQGAMKGIKARVVSMPFLQTKGFEADSFKRLLIPVIVSLSLGIQNQSV